MSYAITLTSLPTTPTSLTHSANRNPVDTQPVFSITACPRTATMTTGMLGEGTPMLACCPPVA